MRAQESDPHSDRLPVLLEKPFDHISFGEGLLHTTNVIGSGIFRIPHVGVHPEDIRKRYPRSMAEARRRDVALLYTPNTLNTLQSNSPNYC